MQAVLQKPEVRWWVFVGPAAILLGATLAYNPDLGFIVFGALCLSVVLTLPVPLLLGLALVCALSLRIAVTFGWIPTVASFADIPLVWLALAVTLIHPHLTSPLARRIFRLVMALLVSVAVAWIFNPSEVLRPFLYAALIGEPFAIVATMLLAPPSLRARRALVWTIIVLLGIQVPVCIFQAITLGLGDSVAGTLYGAGAGAHVMGGCLALGIIFCLSSRHPWRYIAIAGLGIALVLADAKQVYVALLAALIVERLVSVRRFRFLSVVLLLALAVPLLLRLPTFETRWQQFQTKETGKTVALNLLAQDLNIPTVLVGYGPAETVSRSAFLTTDQLLREGSPLRAFDLHAAQIATQANLASLDPYVASSSSTSALSSAMGVAGDLGLLGISVVALLILTIIRGSRQTLYGPGVLGAWSLYVLLGIVYDWWEQPPFTTLLAVLTGLTLTASSAPLIPGNPHHPSQSHRA